MCRRLRHVPAVAGRAHAPPLLAGYRQGGPSMAPSCLAADGNAKGSHGCRARLSREATTKPCPHDAQRALPNPKQRMPQVRYDRSSRSTCAETDAQRSPDSRASLRGALRRSCRAESSPAGVARSGGNSQCRRAGGLWAASVTQSGRPPWAHQSMDGKSIRPYTSVATRPMRATLTRAAFSPAGSTRATSRFRQRRAP